MNPMPKQKTWKSKKYLDHVWQYPCVICGRMPVEAHHVRYSFNSGTGIKPGDCWTIPLCQEHHRELHQIGMKSFQKKYDINIHKELFLIAKAWIEKGE